MNKLTFFRERAGISGAELARRVGATQPEIWRLERWPDKGGRKMSKEWADRLAPELGISPVELLYDPGDEITRGTGESGAARLPKGVNEDGVPYVSKADTGSGTFREAVESLLSGRPDAHAWTMKSDVLALKGIRAGDVMIIDRSVPPQNGDIVCVQVEDGLGAKTIFRVYQMPNVVGASFDPSAVRPEAVDGERVRIAGVMTELLRRRNEVEAP